MKIGISTFKRQRYHFLSIIVYAGFLYMMGLLTTNRSYINQGDGMAPFLTNKEYFFTFIGAFAFLAFAYYLSIKTFKSRPRIYILIAGLIFACLGSVPIILHAVNGEFGFLDVSRYLSFWYLTIAGVIFTLECFPKTTKGTYIYSLVAIGLILTALYGCVYSYIAEWPKYQRIIDGDFITDNYPLGFTSNRNIYAWLLLVGQIAACYLQTRKPRIINWILILFFGFNQFFVVSKTCFILSLVLLGAFFIYRVVVSLRQRKVFTIILLVAVGAAIFALIVAGINLPDTILGTWWQHTVFVFDKVGDRFGPSYNSRVMCFQKAWEVASVDTLKLIFGYGHSYWPVALYAHDGKYVPMDITWGVALLENGIVGIVLSAIVWIYALVIITKAMVQKMKGGFFFSLVWLIFVARSFAEAADFLNFDAFGIVLYLLIYLPPASYLAKRKEELSRTEDEEPVVMTAPKHETASCSTIYAIVTPIFAVLMAFAWQILPGYSLLVNLIISFVLFPMLLYGFYYGYKKGKEVLFVVGLVLSFMYMGVSFFTPFIVDGVLGCIIPLGVFIIPLCVMLVVVDKNLLVGQVGYWIVHLAVGLVIGLGFYTLAHFYFAGYSTYSIVLCVFDVLIVSVLVEIFISTRIQEHISYCEYQFSRCIDHLEKIELVGLFTRKAKREEKYRELNIYNL